jgi:hypothetical protein
MGLKTCHLPVVIALASLAFFAAVPALAADTPAIQWQNVLGGNTDDIAYSISQTSDGGYIVAGTTVQEVGGTSGSRYPITYTGSGGTTILLTNLLIGETVEVISKTQRYSIRAESVNPTAAPTAGSGTISSENTDILVIKLDSSGNVQWQKVYGSGYDDGASAVMQTSDGGYVLAGYTGAGGNRDVLILRLDSSGGVVWQKVMGGSYVDTASDIRQTTDGGYIVAGTSYSSTSGIVGASHGSGDVWVIRLDQTGTVVWQRLYGGYGDDNGYSIRQTSDGGYILTGSTYSDNSGDVGPNHGPDDMWVVKLDSSGTIQWQKVLGGNAHETGYSIRQTTDGGYIVAGVTGSNNTGDVGPSHGNGDYWVVKLNSAGTIQWQKVLGGSKVDNGRAVEQTSDGGYIVTGYSTSDNSGDVGPGHNSCDAWVVKLDSAGTIQWQKPFGGSGTEWGMDIRQTSDGGYIFTGQTDSSNNGDVGTNHGRNDFWVVKLAPDSVFPFALSATATNRIPSVGQASLSYKVGFDGLRYNADGKNALDIDLAKARKSTATVSVYPDRVEVFQRDPGGVLITFRGTAFTVNGDRLSGPVTLAELVTDPVTAPLTPGTVSGSLWTVLPELMQQGTLTTTISDMPASSFTSQSMTLLAEHGLTPDSIAYTYDVRKSAMPRSARASVNLSLPERWVQERGGANAIRIIRVSDTTGTAEILPLTSVTTDGKGMMYFEAASVNGTSVFGLATLKISGMAQEQYPGLTLEPTSQPAITTFVGMVFWLISSTEKNPAGAIAVVTCAVAAYAGRMKGMW